MHESHQTGEPRSSDIRTRRSDQKGMTLTEEKSHSTSGCTDFSLREKPFEIIKHFHSFNLRGINTNQRMV
jgi:hypothetical protein